MNITTTAFARGDAGGLASLPQVLLKLLESCDDGDAASSELVRVVSLDQAMSAKMFALGHAARERRCGVAWHETPASLNEDIIKWAVIGASGHPILLRYADQWRAHLQRLWLRSITCAHLAGLLAELTDYPDPREAWFGGLFHNLGQLALGGYAPDQYPNLLAVAQDGRKLVELENSHFDTDHYQVGAGLIETWRLHSFIADAVRYQAEPASALRDAHPLVRLVNVARGMAAAEDERRAAVETAARFFPHLKSSRLRKMARRAIERVSDDAAKLGITLEHGEAARNAEDKTYKLTARIRDMAILDGISDSIATGADAAALARDVRCGLQVLMGANAVRLLVYDADKDMLEDGDLKAAGGFTLPVEGGASLPARALSRKELLVSADVETRSGLVVADRQLLKLLDAEAMLCVPFSRGDAGAGVVTVGVSRAELPLSRERVALLNQLARRVGQAMLDHRRIEAGTGRGPSLEGFERHVRAAVHEARNPLTTVRNYVQIISKKHAGEDWAGRDLKIVGEEIERIDGILSQLDELSHGHKNTPGSVALNRTVADMVWIQQTSTLERHNIKVDLDLAEDVPLLAIDPDGIKQVINNLINNAVEAMPEGGEIQIATRAGLNVNGQLFAEVSIRDSGKGMTPALVDRVFDSGSSSKGEDRGLGLAIVARLVEEWGGSISCRSQPGAGTTFDVLLPYQAREG